MWLLYPSTAWGTTPRFWLWWLNEQNVEEEGKFEEREIGLIRWRGQGWKRNHLYFLRQYDPTKMPFFFWNYNYKNDIFADQMFWLAILWEKELLIALWVQYFWLVVESFFSEQGRKTQQHRHDLSIGSWGTLLTSSLHWVSNCQQPVEWAVWRNSFKRNMLA